MELYNVCQITKHAIVQTGQISMQFLHAYIRAGILNYKHTSVAGTITLAIIVGISLYQ